MIREQRYNPFNEIKSDQHELSLDVLKAQNARLKEQLEKSQEQVAHLEKLAYTDELTGLLNRNGMKKLLEEHLAGREKDKDKPMSILVLDVDHFKKINDEFGHHVGDEVLRVLGQELLRSVRSTDIVARWGGEELVVVFPGFDEDAVLDKFTLESGSDDSSPSSSHAHFKRTITVQNQTIEVTFSGGVTSYDPSTESYDVAMQRADFALYKAKGDHAQEGGRNRIFGAKKLFNKN